jgi:hypothetical protein
MINRKVIGTLCLVLSSFLNPLGFDILVYKLTQLTNDYWSTMYALYASAALFFGFSYLAFKIGKKALGNMLLTLGLFLNPLGYDIVVYGITLITHSYWATMKIMYLLTSTFFLLFLYLYKMNPIKLFVTTLKQIYNKIN